MHMCRRVHTNPVVDFLPQTGSGPRPTMCVCRHVHTDPAGLLATHSGPRATMHMDRLAHIDPAGLSACADMHSQPLCKTS